MLRILLIGCGDMALRLRPLLPAGARVYGLLRHPARAVELRAHDIIPVAGDLDDLRTLRRLGGLASLVFYLAPPANSGERDARARHCVAALARRGSLPRRVVVISTSGVYGDCGGAWVDETRPVAPHTGRALRRVDAERVWRGFARRSGVKLGLLRVAGIRAENRLPLDRLREGAVMPLPEDDAWVNHIHADDLARALCAAAWRSRGGRCFNAADGEPVRMGDYFDHLARRFDLPLPRRLPREALRAQVSPAFWSYLAESRRLRIDRLQRELRVRPRG